MVQRGVFFEPWITQDYADYANKSKIGGLESPPTGELNFLFYIFANKKGQYV